MEALRQVPRASDRPDLGKRVLRAARCGGSPPPHLNDRMKGAIVTRKEILQILKDDPQRLIDEKIEMDFGSNAGHAKMVDGIAAGDEYHGLTFISGPYAGKTVYCGYLGKGCWEYETDISDDGFLFNWKNEEDSVGDHIPELNNKTLTLK